MRQIVIGFSKPKTFKLLSYLIRKFDKSEYSHVYIRLYSTKYDRHMIYQASGLEVNFIEKSRFESYAEVVEEIHLEVTDETYIKVMQKAIDLAGAGYGISQLFGNAVSKLLKLKKNPFKKGYVCSELVAEILKEMTVDVSGKDINLLTPKDIHELLQDCEE